MQWHTSLRILCLLFVHFDEPSLRDHPTLEQTSFHSRDSSLRIDWLFQPLGGVVVDLAPGIDSLHVWLESLEAFFV